MQRQKLLILYLTNSTPDSAAIGWSIYDGTDKQKPPSDVDSPPPYGSALDAMRDGWRILRMPDLRPDYPGREYRTDYLKYEFVLEKLVDTDE